MSIDRSDASSNATDAIGHRIKNAKAENPKDLENQISPEIAADLSATVTEVRGAKLFTYQSGQDWRYVEVWGRWLFWTGTHWQFDDQLLIRNRVEKVVCQIGTFAKTEKQLIQIETLRMMNSIEGILKADRAHAASVDLWDQNQFLLNTPAGTFDLKSGTLGQHKRSDHITKMTSVSPKGDCPRWLAFLHQSTGGDLQVVDYLRKAVGYCLTGSTQEHVFFFLFGTGGNGKSLFVDVLSTIMGSYATVAPMDMFMESRSDRHPAELAKLRGHRLVTATETEDGRRWAEAKLKTLTGGDRITARFMREDWFEYEPNFKLIMCGNHKPTLTSIGPSMKRRLILIPFPVTIPEDQRDPELKAKLLEEAEGILQWAIEGAMEWQGEGLNAPDSIRAATSEYFAEEDVLSQFIEEECEVNPEVSTSNSDLYARYQIWAERRGDRRPRDIKWLTKSLTERGFVRFRKAGVRGILGIIPRSAGAQVQNEEDGQ